MANRLLKIFLKGLAFVVPVALTAYFVWWAGTRTEGMLKTCFLWVFPDRYYVPGLGLVAGILGTFGVGVLMHLYLLRRLFRRLDDVLRAIPGVKSVYGTIREFMEFVSAPKHGAVRKVVVVTLGDPPARLVGLVTRESFADTPAGIADADTVAVYLPMSYQLGGYTVFVPRAAIRPVAMSVEDAMRFTLTAGVSSPKAPAPETRGESSGPGT